MAYIEYGCPPLPNHELVNCGNYGLGGIPSIAILLDSSDFVTPADWSSASAYTNAYNSGRMVVINNIRGTVPDATPSEIDNPVGCFSNSIVGGFDWTITWIDANTTDSNIDFYRALNKRVANLIIYIPKSNEVMVVESATNFVCNPIVVPSSNRELQQFNCTARTSFGPSDLPQKYPAPSNASVIFTSCNKELLAPAPAVGSLFGGGIVFEVDTANRLAYVVADVDPMSATYQWSASTLSVPGVNVSTTAPTSFSAVNTSTIISAGISGITATPAASWASGLTHATFSDWVLPTRDALLNIANNVWETNIGTFINTTSIPTTTFFWSSNDTGGGTNGTRVQFLVGGSSAGGSTFKTISYRALAIRSQSY